MEGKHWDSESGEFIVDPKVDAFIADLVDVCRKHNLSLGHEDHRGAFEVYRGFNKMAVEWLRGAQISPNPSEK